MTRPGDNNRPDPPVDWLLLVLGAGGTVGAVVAWTLGEWLWASIVFGGSILAELLVAGARRRRARRGQSS